MDVANSASVSRQALQELATSQIGEENRLWKMFVQGWNADQVDTYLKEYDLVTYLRDRYQLVQLGNKWVDHTKPWEIAKTDLEQAKRDLQALIWLIKGTALLSAPFLLDGFARFKELVQIQHADRVAFGTESTTTTLPHLFDLKQVPVTRGEGYLY